MYFILLINYILQNFALMPGSFDAFALRLRYDIVGVALSVRVWVWPLVATFMRMRLRLR